MSKELALELKKSRGIRGAEDLAAALRPLLASQHGIELVSLEGESSTGALRGRATIWLPLKGRRLGALDGVHVALPVDLDVRLEGHSAIVTAADPTAAELAEAESFVAGLAARGQVDFDPGKPAARATHRVEIDAHGRRLLKRSRFSAVKL